MNTRATRDPEHEVRDTQKPSELVSVALGMALQHIRICAPDPTVDAALEKACDALRELKIPTPSAHSGEGKPSDRAVAEAFREYLHTVTVTAHTRNALMHILDRARELERKHEQSEPVAVDDSWPTEAQIAKAQRWVQSSTAYACDVDRPILLALDLLKSREDIAERIAPPPSEQAGISDYDATKFAQAFNGAMWQAILRHDAPTLAAIKVALQSAFPRGVGSGEIRLWDSQWVNVVNHDNCYRDWDKEEAINHAVKLTEQLMRENITKGFPPAAHPAPEAQAEDMDRWLSAFNTAVVPRNAGTRRALECRLRAVMENERWRASMLKTAYQAEIAKLKEQLATNPQPSASETPSAKDALLERMATKLRAIKGRNPTLPPNEESIAELLDDYAAIAAQRKEGE